MRRVHIRVEVEGRSLLDQTPEVHEALRDLKRAVEHEARQRGLHGVAHDGGLLQVVAPGEDVEIMVGMG